MLRRITSQPYGEALISMLADFDADAERITGDLERLVAELSAAGLLRHAGE